VKTKEELRERSREAMRRLRAKINADPVLRAEYLARRKKRREMNIDAKREQDRLAKQRKRQADPERYREQQREWYRRNPEKIRAYSAKQYARIQAIPELAERVRRRHRIEGMTRDQVLSERQRKRELRRMNLARKRAAGISLVNRYRNPQRHALDYRCYRSVREMLLLGHIGRLKTYDYLAFTSLELVAHIGRLLIAAGLEWSGYGTVWNIDHERPLAEFDYSSDQDEAFKECWSLANLRPMLVTHNLCKGRRRDGDWSFVT